MVCLAIILYLSVGPQLWIRQQVGELLFNLLGNILKMINKAQAKH